MIWLPAGCYEVLELARLMRASDLSEVQFNAETSGAALDPGWSIQGDLLRAVGDRNVWCMWDGDEIAGCAGVADNKDDEGVGVIWFLGTKLADEKPYAMTQASRRFIRFQSKFWKILGNVVPAHMTKRVSWLETLGFDTRKVEAQEKARGYIAFWRFS